MDQSATPNALRSGGLAALSATGKLAFSPSRMVLISEFDELIEAHGWNARGADFFL